MALFTMACLVPLASKDKGKRQRGRVGQTKQRNAQGRVNGCTRMRESRKLGPYARPGPPPRRTTRIPTPHDT